MPSLEEIKFESSDIAKSNLTVETNTNTVENDFFLKLEKKYLEPDDIEEKFDLWLDSIRSIPNEEKIFFTQNLGIMIASGLSLSRALRTLALQTMHHKFKRALFKIYHQVDHGISLAEAIKKFPKIFSNIFVSMIKAGESSGQLEKILAQLTQQLKRSHALKQKIRGALLYPMVILTAIICIGLGMIIFVVPKLLSIFKEMSVQLPLPTQILIIISDTINNNIFIFTIIIMVIIIIITYTNKQTAGKYFWHWLFLKTPILKNIVIKTNLAKISRNLGSLLSTDMPIIDSLKLTSEVVNNVYFRDSLCVIAGGVEKGLTISSQLTQFKNLYPPVIEQMMAVGEESGEVSKILIQLADFYEEDVNQTMDSLPALIEPILILILGGAVGGMAIAIILPMYSLTQAV